MKCCLIEHNQTKLLRNLVPGKAPDKKNIFLKTFSYFSMNIYNVFNH